MNVRVQFPTSGIAGERVTVIAEADDGALLAGTAANGIFRADASTLGVSPITTTARRASIMLVPNPSAEQMRIALPDDISGHVTVDVMSLLGERVMTIADGEAADVRGGMAVDVTGLAPGTYFCRVHDARGCTAARLSIVR